MTEFQEVEYSGGTTAYIGANLTNRPLHILHVALSNGWNAGTAQVATTIQAQMARGYRITAHVLADSLLSAQLSRLQGDLHLSTQMHHGSPSTPFRMRRLLKAENPDLVHFHRRRGAVALGLALRGLNRRIPTVRSLRDPPLPRSWVPYRLDFGYFDRLIFPNRYVESLYGSVGDGGMRGAILPASVDTVRFVPKKHENQPLRVGLFGRFDPIKGHRYFLEACRSLIQSGIFPPFQIVLSGKNFDRRRDDVLRLAAELGVAGHCQVLDNALSVEEEQSRLDIGVVASIGSEELLRVPLEYMACGIPVVATTVGGLPELISRHVGFLVPPKDSSALAEAISCLLIDEDLRENLGARGRRAVEEKFALPQVVEMLEDIYREVLEESEVSA